MRWLATLTAAARRLRRLHHQASRYHDSPRPSALACTRGRTSAGQRILQHGGFAWCPMRRSTMAHRV